ncbi:MAG TPA: PIN domain-containing protein [Candidatus Nanoarchaeia archaeon]|nr:PIN domain-containing protein [Candidatus Nanoarchaeia archaeon]
MNLIVDTNCLISSLISNGKSREIICLPGITLYAPENIIEETLNNKEEIILRAEIDEQSFNQLISIFLLNIKIISKEDFKEFKEKAKELVTHPEDIPFMALALKLNYPLWSNDKNLKLQSKVKVFSTTDLIKVFGF